MRNRLQAASAVRPRHLLVSLLLAGLPGLVQAQLLNNVSIGNPKGLALGNAVTADPPGVDAIHFNPAGLTRISGRQMNLKLLAAHVALESRFGDPQKPTQGEKQAYYAVNEACQTDYPITTPESAASAYDQCWGIDPVAGATARSGDPVVMIPLVGMQEVPLLAFPMGGMAFASPDSAWVAGSAVYVPEGIGFTRDEDGAGAYQGQQVALTRLTYFSPTLALQLTDTLSAGIGLNLSYQGMYVQTQFRAPTLTLGYLRDLNNIAGSPLPPINFGPYDSAGTLTMEVEDLFSVGFNFGLLWEATDWLSLGFVYHSESLSDLSGDFRMENSDLFLETVSGLKENPLVSGLVLALSGGHLNAQAVESGHVEMEYCTPANLAFGASVQMTPALKFNVDLKWSDYSRWDDLEFYFDQDVDFLSFGTAISAAAGYKVTTSDMMAITRRYQDTWSWAFGVEYRLNANWVARAGYEPRSSAIPEDRTDLIFPITDADLYAVGLGWQFDRSTQLDAAVGYLHSAASTPACQSENANSCLEGNVVYNPYYATDFSNEVNAWLLAVSMDRKF